MSERLRAHVWVTGRVQGVFFRQSTMERATELGLAGWVRNLPDGRVEAMAEGAPPAVEALIRYCHRGPEFAHVEHVEVVHEPAAGDLPPFEARH